MRAIRSGFGALGLLVAASGCVIDELVDDDVGDAPFCDAASPWPRDYADFEATLLDRIDTVRRQGRTCGKTHHNPVATPELSPELHCAARIQATWLAEHDGLSHDGYDTTTPLSRAALAGYRGSLRYELLARDFAGPGATLAAWLDDEQHCAALLDRAIVDIGVGHSRSAKGDAYGWVVVLGEQRPD